MNTNIITRTLALEDDKDWTVTISIPLSPNVEKYDIAVDWDNQVAFYRYEDAEAHIAKRWKNFIMTQEEYFETMGEPMFTNEEEEDDFYTEWERYVQEKIDFYEDLTFTHYIYNKSADTFEEV